MRKVVAAQPKPQRLPDVVRIQISARGMGIRKLIAGRRERAMCFAAKIRRNGFDQPIKQSVAIERRSQSRTTRDTTVPRPSSNLSPLPPYSTVAGIRAIDMSGCAT